MTVPKSREMTNGFQVRDSYMQKGIGNIIFLLKKIPLQHRKKILTQKYICITFLCSVAVYIYTRIHIARNLNSIIVSKVTEM